VELLKQVILEKPKFDGKIANLEFSEPASPGFVKVLLEREFNDFRKSDAQGNVASPLLNATFEVFGEGENTEGRYRKMRVDLSSSSFAAVAPADIESILEQTREEFQSRPQPERLENFDKQLASDTQTIALTAVLASWIAILLYLWFRFGSWTFGLAAVICLAHDLLFTLGIIAFCHYIVDFAPGVAGIFKIEDFKIDLPSVAALLTLIGYSVSDTIVVFDRIREVRGKNPLLTAQMINDSINQTLSRTILASTTVFLVVVVLYWFGGEGVHLFAFVMVVGVIVGTYSSIYIASPLLLIFGEGNPEKRVGGAPQSNPAPTTA
jgi:SecD/SecF fusion protein